MKKVLTLMAVLATVCFVSCKKDPTPEPTPKDETVTATITANDVTVEEGASVKIGATTNSSASITYSSADAAIATVSATGEVTGVKAGSTNITLKVAAVEGKFTAAEKTIKVTVTAKEVPPATLKEITIDGNFDDWAELEKGTYSQTYGDEDATHPALTHCKVYATADFIYVYFEWDPEYIEDMSWVPFHCYINTDGDETTGGYADEFSDACSDVLLEGSIYGGGEICSYWAGGYAWIGEPNAQGWSWTPDTDNLFPEEAPTVGAGVEGKYEMSISRAMFASVGFPVADVFSIGFDIQQNWESVGVLPNASPSEDNAAGVVASLKVTTQK